MHNLKEIKDGVMNFARQISAEDRKARDINLRPTFDFEGWLNALDHSIRRFDEEVNRDQAQRTATVGSPGSQDHAQEQPVTSAPPALTGSYIGGNTMPEWNAHNPDFGPRVSGFYSLDGLGELLLEDRDGAWVLDDWDRDTLER